jgi:hypothetical protein
MLLGNRCPSSPLSRLRSTPGRRRPVHRRAHCFGAGVTQNIRKRPRKLGERKIPGAVWTRLTVAGHRMKRRCLVHNWSCVRGGYLASLADHRG